MIVVSYNNSFLYTKFLIVTKMTKKHYIGDEFVWDFTGDKLEIHFTPNKQTNRGLRLYERNFLREGEKNVILQALVKVFHGNS